MTGVNLGVGTQVGVEVIRKQNPVLGVLFLILIIFIIYVLYKKGWF